MDGGRPFSFLPEDPDIGTRSRALKNSRASQFSLQENCDRYPHPIIQYRHHII